MLALIAAVKTGFEIAERGPNFYQMLDVSRGSSPLDIKRAYKRMSLELHPDKNPSATAVDEFAKLKDAYDVLMDTEMKDVYNRFGEDGIKKNQRIDEYRMLLEITVFYVAWGIMTFMLTMGKSSAVARQWTFTGLIAMFVVEVLLMLNEIQLPEWFLPRNTQHEIIVLLHSLFPAYLNGCRCIGGVLYLDLEEQTRQLLLALHEQNKELIKSIHNLQTTFSTSIQGRDNLGSNTSSFTPGLPEGSALSQDAVLNKIEATLRANGSITADTSGRPPTAHPASISLLKPENKQSNLGLYLMIAAYIGAYYLFSS
eukprot:CAMPEP_0197285742 /NCGR_PEP_ID=MMETSP0890-20130614/1104_1 /TAXON_ID=44058 ORGANISM="Aureoumbra lagunensis, Strain CCMP1510" /NCGR_SAMPLE_ID=MMETSP0890 /ASSEMBLY_ACC=CAM_ASM_000533 /LENGTH=311 /DNA_ID=CAMNT_0042753545 /DNA_START=199 /DNA_END=1137 /DNA_ORIENTATION=-